MQLDADGVGERLDAAFDSVAIDAAALDRLSLCDDPTAGFGLGRNLVNEPVPVVGIEASARMRPAALSIWSSAYGGLHVRRLARSPAPGRRLAPARQHLGTHIAYRPQRRIDRALVRHHLARIGDENVPESTEISIELRTASARGLTGRSASCSRGRVRYALPLRSPVARSVGTRLPRWSQSSFFGVLSVTILCPMCPKMLPNGAFPGTT